MKKYKVSDTLTEGDIVECGVDGTLFKATQFDKSKPCGIQCSMVGTKDHAYCTGFCYRWENGEDFVFVEAEGVDKKNATVVETVRTSQSKEDII